MDNKIYYCKMNSECTKGCILCCRQCPKWSTCKECCKNWPEKCNNSTCVWSEAVKEDN